MVGSFLWFSAVFCFYVFLSCKRKKERRRVNLVTANVLPSSKDGLLLNICQLFRRCTYCHTVIDALIVEDGFSYFLWTTLSTHLDRPELDLNWQWVMMLDIVFYEQSFWQ